MDIEEEAVESTVVAEGHSLTMDLITTVFPPRGVPSGKMDLIPICSEPGPQTYACGV